MATYRLINWESKDLYNSEITTIYLYGENYNNEAYTEHLTLKRKPGETARDLIRCAVALSPNKWWVDFKTNTIHFQDTFYEPLSREALNNRLSAVPDKPDNSAQGDKETTQ